MITLEHVTLPAMEQAAAEAGIVLPIEQTEAWGRYQAKYRDATRGARDLIPSATAIGGGRSP